MRSLSKYFFLFSLFRILPDPLPGSAICHRFEQDIMTPMPLLTISFSNTADEIKSIDQAVEYILAQPEAA